MYIYQSILYMYIRDIACNN